MSDNIDIIENILSFSDEHEWFDYKENWFQKKKVLGSNKIVSGSEEYLGTYLIFFFQRS